MLSDQSVDFIALYATWLNKTDAEKAVAREALLRSYRSAWEAGDSRVRQTVLLFVFLEREEAGFGLVLSGLRSTAHDLACTAEAVAFGLVVKGHNLGPDARNALQEMTRRFPEERELARSTLARLASKQEG